MPRRGRAWATFLVGVLLVSMLLGSSVPAAAQVSNWASTQSVQDLTGNVALRPGDPMLAGHTYNATVKISVPLSQNISRFTVALNPAVLKNASQFWYLQTPNYPGFDNVTWTPSLRTVGFNQKLGTLVLSAVFKIPVNYTVTNLGEVALHLAKPDFVLVSVTVTGGTAGGAGEIVRPVSDQSIQTYLTTYQAKSTLIASGQVDSSYSNLLNGVLNLSQLMYTEGLTVQATSLLDNMVPSALPVPNNSYVTYITVALILFAVLAAAFAVVYLRGRGKIGYSSGVMNEVNRQLASFEIIAGRYDKALADQLKGLREKLTEAS